MPACFNFEAVSIERFSSFAARAIHRRVDDDGKARSLDFIYDQMRFARAVEDDAKIKFFGDAERGHNILRALRRDEQRNLALDDFLPSSPLSNRAARLCNFPLLSARRGASRPVWRACRAIVPVRRAALSPMVTAIIAVGTIVDVVNRFAECFGNHRLTGNQRGGRVSGVNGRDAETAHPFDEFFFRDCKRRMARSSGCIGLNWSSCIWSCGWFR